MVQSGIELSGSGLQITNRFLYIPNQKHFFNFFTNHKYNYNYEVVAIKEATTKTTIHRTRLTCNNACNTDNTTSFSVIFSL